MSRETDSTSSGPQGRGGAAYPSGTPPYGTRPFPSLHPQDPQRAGDPTSGPAAWERPAAADEPRTETTLTTRVRINIPGSRPIPPVVVRKPVDGDSPDGRDGDGAAPDPSYGWPAAATGGQPGPGPRTQAVPTANAAAPAEAPEKNEKDKAANDWFAPRKPVTRQAPPAASPAAPHHDSPPAAVGLHAPAPGLDAAPFDAPAPRLHAASAAPFDVPPASAAGPLDAAPSSAVDATQPMSLADFSGLAPHTPPPPAGYAEGAGYTGEYALGGLGGPGRSGEYPLGGADGPGHSGEYPIGGPDGPGHTGGYALGGLAGPGRSGEYPLGGADGPGHSGEYPLGGPDGPGHTGGYALGGPDGPGHSGGYPLGGADGPGHTGEYPLGGPDGPGHSGEYPSPSTAPAEPASAAPAPAGADAAGADPAAGPRFAARQAAGPFGTPLASGPRPFIGASPRVPVGSTPFPSYQPPAAGGPAGPTTGPVIGAVRTQAPRGAAAPGTAGAAAVGAPGDAADTLVGGIPMVTDPAAAPRSRTAPAAAPGVPYAAEESGAPYRSEEGDKPYGAEETDEPETKGRSKLILAGVGLLAAVGIAYGAGLLVDHADVPAGTTVFGVDIGGKSKEDAVLALDEAIGDRPSDPISVKAGSKAQDFTPAVAGLGLDVDATVNNVAHHDYNPIVVIGSLFGRTRAARPAWQVDEEKLTAQLNTLAAGDSASGSDGIVRFVNGHAVAVPGKAHPALDVQGSAAAVIAAYERHVAADAPTAVTLPVRTVQPKVTQAQLNAALGGFAKTAMSGLVTVKAGGVEVQFSPERSLSQFLTMVPDSNGDLQPHFDLAVLKKLYGGTFDGILLERGNGSRTAVTPQDVASAMLPALRTTDQSQKTVTLPNVG